MDHFDVESASVRSQLSNYMPLYCTTAKYEVAKLHTTNDMCTWGNGEWWMIMEDYFTCFMYLYVYLAYEL
jgi:hypothetical protein